MCGGRALQADDQQRLFQMVAHERIPKGAPLTDSYGDRPNGDLFRNYGFFMESNMWDALPLFADVRALIASLAAASHPPAAPPVGGPGGEGGAQGQSEKRGDGESEKGEGAESGSGSGKSESGGSGGGGSENGESESEVGERKTEGRMGNGEAGEGESQRSTPLITPGRTVGGPLGLSTEALAEVAANASAAARAAFLVAEGLPTVGVLRRVADVEFGRRPGPDKMLNTNEGGYLDHSLVAILIALHIVQRAPGENSSATSL